MTKNIAIICV